PPRLLVYVLYNHPANTEIYTLSLNDALPISGSRPHQRVDGLCGREIRVHAPHHDRDPVLPGPVRDPAVHLILGAEPGQEVQDHEDRKSTRLNSSHVEISYAVFWLKKKRFCFA